jgi:predicted N-acyltransferase
LDVQIINSITEIDHSQWNALTGIDYPFLRHEFLSALEQSGSVSEETGWRPQHLLVRNGDEVLALMPMYLKTHSWGEYVFDQTWAQAYQAHGLAYYPKYLTSIPFTPCQGPRLVIKPGIGVQQIIDPLLNFIQQQTEQRGVSSWHCLLPDVVLKGLLHSSGLIIREDVQFQWLNRDYRTLDDFLQTLTASKRKMIKRERRKVVEQGIHLVRLQGKAIDHSHWQTFYQFYASTYLKRHSHPYLNLQFFYLLAETMPEQLQLVLAMNGQTPVAAALFFVGADTLYGRYWGCAQAYDTLHFETCYYQGIEYCIEHSLRRFDSGAQGEHKIARGFEPVTTYSAHWIKDQKFAQAIADFVDRERIHINRYKSNSSEYLPFKQGVL